MLVIQLKIISTSGRKVLNFHKSNFGQVIAKMSRQVAIFLVILSFFKIQKWVSLTAFPQFFFTPSLFAVAVEKCILPLEREICEHTSFVSAG